MNNTIAAPAQTRSQRLKAATHAVHDVLDKRIMAADIFASRDHFTRFLCVQYRFHRHIDGLYSNAQLAALLPELDERRRLPKIAIDIKDLGKTLPPDTSNVLGAGVALATSLGWLYVAEGSNLGGTVLFKMANNKLGLARDFGARHLAAHEDGAARHWRQFTTALDAVALSFQQEEDVINGAQEAFRTVCRYVEEELPLSVA